MQRAGIDLALYFDDLPSSQLTHHYLMDEAIVPVCTADYARQHQLQQHPDNLQHCTLLHDRRPGAMILAPTNGLAGQHFGVNLPQSSGIARSLRFGGDCRHESCWRGDGA